MLNLAMWLAQEGQPNNQLTEEQLKQFQTAAAGGAMVFLAVYGAIILLMVISMWKIFTKAGEPGWAAIVPIYNLVVMLKITGKPIWLIVLCFIPIVSIVVPAMVCQGLAERFGKGTGYAIGLFLLGIIFFPMLAFGSAQYTPPPQGKA